MSTTLKSRSSFFHVHVDTYGDNDGMTNLDALAIQKRMLKLE